MTPRLYGSTRPLFVQVWHALCRLGIARTGTPTAQVLVALYVTGLVLLDARQTQTRVASFLPGRCHDALNRLLRVMPLSTRAVMRLLAGWAGRLGDGYLCLGFGYVTFDTQYTAGWFTKMVDRLGMPWVGTLAANTAVVWRGQRQSVSELGERLRLQ